MSVVDRIMNNFGYKREMTQGDCYCDNVQIQDGKMIGNPYAEFGTFSSLMTDAELNAAYNKVSCIGSSVDLISNNIQMIEPVFFDDETRETVEYTTDKYLKTIRALFEKPNATDNRKTFLNKITKSYIIHGAIYFAFVMNKNVPVSIKVIDNECVNYSSDITNARIGEYRINNSGTYDGTYVFDGVYYTNTNNSSIILAPYINSDPKTQYLPTSPLLGAGLETLMYWYGCYHNKSLLQNGSRPSLIVMIKSLLNPKHREELKNEIKIRHAGAGNAGSAIILDGAADKDVKQVSQNNKDMEYSSVLKSAEEAIYRRLGVQWLLGEKASPKDYGIGLETMYDMTVCPMFQAIYNHLFDVCKYYKVGYSKYRIFYLEQDIPALRARYLRVMKELPTLGIFTVNERRKAYNYPPLDDFRGDELTVQSVKVTQSGMSPTKENTTTFSGNDEQSK